jgi:hypothetical protein
MPKHRALRLRGVHTAAHPDARKRRKFPSQVWASFTVSPTSHRTEGGTEVPTRHAPSEVPSPTASCQSRGATYPSGIPTRRLRCVPRVSHPLDALLPPRPAGLVSSRFRSWGSPSRLVPCAAPYALSSAGSLGFLARPLRASPPLQGSNHAAQILHAGLGFSQVTAPLPPWDWPLRGFLLRLAWTALPVHLPSRASPGRPRADLPVGAPGYPPTVAQPLSLEIGMASLGFSTSSLSRRFGATPGLGYRFPSAHGPRRRRSVAPLRPSSRPCRSSSRQPFR